MNVYPILKAKNMKRTKTDFRIGVDFDNTIAKPKEFVGTVAARKLGLKNFLYTYDYDFSNCPEEMQKMIFDLFSDPEYMGNMAPLPGAAKKLSQWAQTGFSIVLITNRDEHLRDITLPIINEYFPMIEKAIFVGSGNTKEKEMKEENLSAWVDDNPKEVFNSLKLGLDTCLISNSDTPYNWHLKSNFPGRIFSRVADINFHLN